ncbi:MAG: helix-hairpin-helix domain-containing protein [Bacteroidales bacterium]|nr:helix-hairpin-helix domain-containing protein [Candidatus Colimorpha onthohippi]
MIIIIILIFVLWPAPKHKKAEIVVPDSCITSDSITPHYKSTQTYRYHKTTHLTTDNTRNAYAPDDSITTTIVKQSSTYQEIRPPRRQSLIVDINTADTLTLQLLHGIGPTYARRIVRYRDQLGGFIDISQLLEVYGITADLLNHIAPHLVLSPSTLRQIPINTVSLKELVRHPYLDYYQVRDIIAFRNKGHRYHSPSDLMLISSMTDSTLNRILPYISFD